MTRGSMRLFTFLVPLLMAVILMAGCGGDDSSSSDADASDPGTGDGSTASDEAFTAEKLQALADIQIAGYESLEPLTSATGSMTLSYLSEAVTNDAQSSAVVTLTPCDPFICWDLDGEVTEQQEEGLLSLLAPVHIENPDLIFEYGNMELAPGYEAFYVYTRSFVQDGGSTSTSNSYRVFYHDGVNHITVLVSPRSQGSLASSAGELESQMDQAAGEATAQEVFAAFEGEFAPAE